MKRLQILRGLFFRKDHGGAENPNLNVPGSKLEEATFIKKLKMGARLPLQLVALVTQSSTTAPVVTATLNEFGTIVWARSSAGVYTGTLAGAFKGAFKTVKVSIAHATTGAAIGTCFIEKTSNDVITITTRQVSDGAATDGLLTAFPLNLELVPDSDYAV